MLDLYICISLWYYYLKYFPNNYIIFREISGPRINALINSNITQEGTEDKRGNHARTLNPTDKLHDPFASTYCLIPRLDAHVNTRNYFGKDKRASADVCVALAGATSSNER